MSTPFSDFNITTDNDVTSPPYSSEAIVSKLTCTLCGWVDLFEKTRIELDELIIAANTHKENCIPRVELAMAKVEYPNHSDDAAVANYRAGKEIWDSNGDQW